MLAPIYSMVHNAKRFETGTPDCNFQKESWPKDAKENTSICGVIIMEKKQEADLFTVKEKQSVSSQNKKNYYSCVKVKKCWCHFESLSVVTMKIQYPAHEECGGRENDLNSG